MKAIKYHIEFDLSCRNGYMSSYQIQKALKNLGPDFASILEDSEDPDYDPCDYYDMVCCVRKVKVKRLDK